MRDIANSAAPLDEGEVGYPPSPDSVLSRIRIDLGYSRVRAVIEYPLNVLIQKGQLLTRTLYRSPTYV